MKIIFELVNEQEIKVFGIDKGGTKKEVGCIFTPSSSGSNILNAIQICGADEVFDFWGCSRYIKPKERDIKKRVLNALENKGEHYEQAKDIQIMFSFDTEPSNYLKRNIELNRDCNACFNRPCTCENKDHKENSPYNIKREWQLQDKIEYKEGHVPLKEQEEIMNELKEKQK